MSHSTLPLEHCVSSLKSVLIIAGECTSERGVKQTTLPKNPPEGLLEGYSLSLAGTGPI